MGSPYAVAESSIDLQGNSEYCRMQNTCSVFILLSHENILFYPILNLPSTKKDYTYYILYEIVHWPMF